MNDPRSTPNPHDDTDLGQHGEHHREGSEHDHHGKYRDGSHISWDTDKEGNYVPGSGHTTPHTGEPPTSWDR